jgi:ribosome assembly protein YihI (activator of Der GTPase)
MLGEKVMKEPYATLYQICIGELENEEQRKLLLEILSIMSESKSLQEGCERVKDELLKRVDEIAGELGVD